MPQIKVEERLYSWQPLTSDNWPDLVKLFGEHGACDGCWCMYFRGVKKDYNENKGDGNKHRLEAIVNSGQPTGLIAYDGGEPVGWCAVAPRVDFDALSRSKYYKAVDDIPTWSLTCFFTAKAYRRKGVSRFLIQKALVYAAERGAKYLEAYPIVPKKDKVPDIFAYTGFFKEFVDVGFQEIANLDGLHPIMRVKLG